ncbi:VanZ family protein [Solirubrobacter sp. CPCC 204708]|uniref:VanZ family protein n=1 Tax=Solirubrobacter deserti TaxID=2282478 RepID=A0ABT4RFU3_9ACTN|nr:VanZ family protein [Solirubrobacter deserti]MBE2318075.1 VanZ family protein [Solirubrobacter deserti]MDA0137353.1 VanZ family protein [Solirubrobacter deserti]
MKRPSRRRWPRLLPPLALMALLFALSHQPSLGTGLGVWDLVLRKGAHVTAYALLCLLWYRALEPRRLVAAVLVTLAYAATDEYHQTFIEGRSGTPVDWLIDAAGVGIAAALILVHQRRRPRRGGAFV